jgi:hypothetical protein
MPATGDRGKRKSLSNEKNTAPLKMSDVGCDSVSYRFKVALEKFDLAALREAVHADQTTKRSFHVVNTRDDRMADYHAHFEWRFREKEQEVTIELKYVANPVNPKSGEQEPFSDNVMSWLGQFFKYKDANAKIHSDFAFEAKTATLSWFPLPLRTKIASLGVEAILDGIAIALPSQPEAVSRVFLSSVKDTVYIGMESERRIKFAQFSLEKDLRTERSFADKLIEVKL